MDLLVLRGAKFKVVKIHRRLFISQRPMNCRKEKERERQRDKDTQGFLLQVELKCWVHFCPCCFIPQGTRVGHAENQSV